MAKTYKCQYCEKRFIRKDLINHIENKHEEMIPEGFSASRLVYNQINKVSYGKCRVCGKETTWNEKAGRYNVLCNNPKCKEHMREEYKKNMLRVKGTYNILNDPEQQKKMLANRSISGKYKFTTDGGELTYTGSYEKKCLEFMDVVMQIPSTDILSPGPTLEYEYNGEKHFYITDFYYIPYNLIIEVKDGGDNPNNKKSVGMISSREKTIEKEHLITDKGEYNYIRLTNNNFAQLIEIFMVIKEKLLEGDVSKTYKINESVILESNNEFKNETELLNWMKNNIRYEHNDSSWKLKSYEEVLQTKSGDCHDQSLFEYTVFNRQNIKCGRLFIIEYYGNEIHNAGATHTICYFIKNNKYYWFENAWDNKRGIHGPYSNLNELKEDIYVNWEFSGKNDKLYICNLSGVKPGMDLEEYVTTALDTFIPKKYYNKNMQESAINENDIEQIIFGKKQPLQKQITLYHGTDKSDLNIITPNSYNAGQKNDIPKMSSFWFNQKEYAESFAALTLIENYNYNIYVTLDNDMKVILDREYKNDILKYLKTVKGYVYEKTVDMSIVGYGHEGVFPEYTLDVPVKPDKRYIIMPNNLIKRIKFVSKEYLFDIKTKYKAGKMNYDHNFIQMILDKNILYYPSCNERNNKIKQIAQLADMTNNAYFRITYNNIGIYEAFKQNIPWDVWINFKKSKECNWLPLPPKYEDGYYSYFTYEGYKKFMKLTYPEMIKYLDKYKIKVEKLNIDKNAIIYSDKYQVVVNSKLIQESSINETYINTHNTGNISFMTEAYVDYISRKYKSDVTTINLRFVHSTNAIQAIKSKCKYRIYNNDYIVIDIGYNVYVVDDVVYNRVPQDVTYNSFLKFHLTKVILSRYMKDENERLINAIATYESGVYAESYKVFKSSQIKDAEIYARYLNKYGSDAVVDNLYRRGHTQYPIFEACKDVNEARKFLQDVDKISQKYNANFFIVTDGASMTRNGRGESNPAVKNARDSQVDWENKNGGDPNEDWLKNNVKESTNIFNFIEE